MGAPRLAPDEALLVLLFPCTTAALCDLSAATRALALASLREAISALPASTVRAPAKNAGLDAAVAALLADAKVKANTAPPSREDPPTLPTASAAAVPDIAAFVQRWGRADTKPHSASTWSKKGPAKKKPELVLPAKPRRPQPLDTMPEAVAGRETFADYRRDASNPVVSPWSLPPTEALLLHRPLLRCHEWNPGDGSDAARATALAEVTAVATVSVCGPPITVRCLFDAELHKGRCGAVPEELVGRHVTVWDPYVFITAQGAHEVQVDSAKDVAFHLTSGEIETFGIRDERDGRFALRWLRRAKADGDALMAEDPAAAVRAYTHGLCMCYSRGPLDGDPTFFHTLFNLSGLIASSFRNHASAPSTTQNDAQNSVFAHAAELFFRPDVDTAGFRSACDNIGSPMAVAAALTRAGFPYIKHSGAATPLSAEDVTPLSTARQAQSDKRKSGDNVELCVVRSYPLVAKIVGNISLGCMKLRMWHHAFTAANIAAFMVPSNLADKYYGRAAVAGARLSLDFPLQIPSRSIALSPEHAAERDNCSNGSLNVHSGELAEQSPDIADHNIGISNGKGRGTFARQAKRRLQPVCSSVPFAFSTGADLSSIRYRDWTVPADFAGLFRVLQHRSSLPCASHLQQQQRFLVGHATGVFRDEPMPVHSETCPFNITPFLFHDMCLPLRVGACTDPTQSDSALQTRLGDSFLFDAARAVEVVGTNAMVEDTDEGPFAFLSTTAALCNTDVFPSAVLRVRGTKTPVVVVVAVRPLAAGEEVTIHYDGWSMPFPKRWPNVPRDTIAGETALMSQIAVCTRTASAKTRHDNLRTALQQHAKRRLGWSQAQCTALSKLGFVDVLLRVFGSNNASVTAIMIDFGRMGDDLAIEAMREDARFGAFASSLNIPTVY